MARREWECPLCASHATVLGIPEILTSEYDCDQCGEYTFYDRLLYQMSREEHWEQTRKRLALALKQGGAVRVFKNAGNIVEAVGGLDKQTG
jgi:hypothetical protein